MSEKVVFMSRFKRYQTFGPKGRAIKFIGGRFESSDPDIIAFLRKAIAEKTLLHSGREVVFEKIPPAPPVKCLGCGGVIPATQKFCGICGAAAPVGHLAKVVHQEVVTDSKTVLTPAVPEVSEDKKSRGRPRLNTEEI